MRVLSAGREYDSAEISHITPAEATPAPTSSAIIPIPPGKTSNWRIGGGLRMSKSLKSTKAVEVDSGPVPGNKAKARPIPRNSSMTTAEGSFILQALAQAPAAHVPVRAATISRIQSSSGLERRGERTIAAARLVAVPGAKGRRPSPKTVAVTVATPAEILFTGFIVVSWNFRMRMSQS